MYLFYQKTGGKESWSYVEDTPKNRDMLETKGVAFVSVLSISATDEVDYDKVKYKGDFYFDIDSSDLSESIRITNKLIDKLKEFEVKNIRVFCSGKKGFHVTVPAKVFSSGRQVAYLPYVYGQMAEDLEIEGLDVSVYSGKAGRLWRQPNVLRKGINTYKVQIPLDKARTLTPDKYRVFVSAPSPKIPDEEIVTSLPLSQLYEAAKIKVEKKQKELSKFTFEPLDELKDLAEVPKCITTLVTQGDQKTGANFNKAAMQLAGYIKSAGMEKTTIEALVNTMAKNVNSSTYNTERLRSEHIWSQINRSKFEERMGFVPSYLFSTIDPCGECILCDGTLDKHFRANGKGSSDSDVEDYEVSDNPIFIANGRYWVRAGKNDRPISTFLLEAMHFSEIYDQQTNIPERESTTVQVVYDHLGQTKRYTRNIDERSWDSVAAFKKGLSGIDNVAFMGGEQDLAYLKNFLFSKDSEMGRITKTRTCGMSSYKVHSTGKSCLVYTEPSGSVNMFGETDTHELDKDVPAPPRILEAPDLDPTNEEHVKLAKELCKINAPEKMGIILGWFIACHFRPHFLAYRKEFPLLGLWGNAGSGKTTTAVVMSYLHGCDLGGAEDVFTCSSTNWAIGQYIASSTSTPRLLDEFNKRGLGKEYQRVLETLKSCWGQMAIGKGQLSSRKDGAEVTQTKMTGPVVVMSEQFPEDSPPLIQRMLPVKLSRLSSEGHEESWAYVSDRQKQLSSIGKAFVMQALKTMPSTIKGMLEEVMPLIPSPRELDSRPHLSFRIALVGLKLYEKTLANKGIDVSEEIAMLTKAIIDNLHDKQEALNQVRSRSVVDGIIDIMGQMATDASKNESIRFPMVYGKAYIRDAEQIFIDAEALYAPCKMYARQLGEPLAIQSYRQFRDLLGEEPYFVEDVIVSPLSETRKCICLDVEKLKKKGVSVDLFEMGEDL